MSKRRRRGAERLRADRDAAGLGGGVVGAAHATRAAQAGDQLRTDMDLFRLAVKQFDAVGEAQKKGNFLEYIESAKFNEAATRQGSRVRTVVTAANGAPTGPVDLQFKSGCRALGGVQSKASRSTPTLVRELSKPKYRGMQKLVPSEMAPRVRETSGKLADRLASRGDPRGPDVRDTARTVTGELRHGRVRSGGTSNDTLEQATRQPGRYAAGRELTAGFREAAKAGVGGAMGGGLVAAALSAARGGVEVWQGRASVGATAKRVAKDAAGGAARGAAVAVAGAVLRNAGAKAGIRALSKSNVATGVAAGLIEATGVVIAYAQGRVDGEAAATALGETACSTAAGIYAGAVAGSFLGPAGAAVGSVAGYMLCTFVYQGCLAATRNARLAIEEADRLDELTREVVAELERSRRELERMFDAALARREGEIEAPLTQIEQGLAAGRPDAVVDGLTRFAGTLGKRLGFESFEGFDEWMTASVEPLRI